MDDLEVARHPSEVKIHLAGVCMNLTTGLENRAHKILTPPLPLQSVGVPSTREALHGECLGMRPGGLQLSEKQGSRTV